MGKRILVAEDVRVTRDTLSFILTNRGYEVIESGDGKDALQKARTLAPDVIILDSELPEMSGYDVFRELRRDAACRKIPVLFLVADLSAEELLSRSIPPAEFLVAKPFTAHQMLARVTQVLAPAK